MVIHLKSSRHWQLSGISKILCIIVGKKFIEPREYEWLITGFNYYNIHGKLRD
jgi:hypothetical protein